MNYVRHRMLVMPLLLLSCSSDKATTPAPESGPPACVRDLAVSAVRADTVTLTWTAPGAHGVEGQASRYDLRYSAAPLSESGWASATVADSTRSPGPPGQHETLSIAELTGGTWHVGLKTTNAAHQWSELSNLVDATVAADTSAPSRVHDLAVVWPTLAGVTLTWTAPGDEGSTGSASRYDLRYARAQITDGTWGNATQVPQLPVPLSAGMLQSFAINGLAAGTTYYFAIKTADSVPNWSTLSNVACDSTLSQVRFTHSAPPSGMGVGSAAWSPDGTSMIFGADWNSRYETQIFRMSVGGGAAEQLTNGADVSGPSISADGDRIAFQSTQSDGGVWAMDATSGSTPVLLTGFDGDSSPGYRTAWSPDGSLIAYTLAIYGDPIHPEIHHIYTISSAGGSPEPFPIDAGVSTSGLVWSPDGTRVAFVSDQSGSSNIWVMPAGGGVPERLTSNQEGDSWPAWSPHSDRIAFSSRRAGVNQICVMSSTGADQIQLTFGTSIAIAPSWSPDETRLSYTLGNNTTHISDIWIIRMR